MILLPLEILWNIASFLDLVSYRCFRRVNHILRISVPPRADPLSECHRWLLSTRLERDCKNMPRKLACQSCKQKRPVGDFGFRKPIIGPRLYLYLRKSFLISNILKTHSWLHRYNWDRMFPTALHSYTEDTSSRLCYRHDPIFYLQPTKPVGQIFSIPLYIKPIPQARYTPLQVQMCEHCEHLIEEGDRYNNRVQKL